LTKCYLLRALGYVPDAQATTSDGEPVEIISYPFPSNGHFGINVRLTPGDPTSMVEGVVPEEALDVLPALGFIPR